MRDISSRTSTREVPMRFIICTACRASATLASSTLSSFVRARLAARAEFSPLERSPPSAPNSDCCISRKNRLTWARPLENDSALFTCDRTHFDRPSRFLRSVKRSSSNKIAP